MQKLTVPLIVDTALRVVDRDGLDALTTRALGAALGVRSPSLYHHVASMEALINLMALDMMERHIAHLDPQDDWQEWLRRFAVRGREMTLSVRDGGRIMTAPVPRSAAREEIADRHAAYLMTCGFSSESAYRALGLVSSFVAGWSLNEQNRRGWLVSVMDPETSFHLCLDDVIAGMRQNFVAHSPLAPAAG